MKKLGTKPRKKITTIALVALLLISAITCNSLNQTTNYSANSNISQAQDLTKSIVRIHVEILGLGMAAGSGWVLSDSGLIVTNYHVVEHNPKSIVVIFSDGTSTKAEFIGGDKEGDVAVIKVKTKHELIPLQLGDSNAVKLGDQITIIGNPLDMGTTVTHGIISNTKIEFGDFPFSYIQTDGTINPGNSGGVMLDSNGRIIGMTSLLAPGANGGNGYGFGIWINDIIWSINEISKGIDLTRVKLGIKIDSNRTQDDASNLEKDSGVKITDSVNPALLKNDIIVGLNGAKIDNSDQLHEMLGHILVGDDLVITVIRDGKSIDISLKAAALEFPKPVPVSVEPPPGMKKHEHKHK